MPKKLTSDTTLITVTMLLLIVGIIMVYSSSAIIAMEKLHDPNHYLKRQAGWAAIGLCVMFVLSNIDFHLLSKLTLPATFMSIVLLTLVFIPPFGREGGGAKRWLEIGGLSFQPSELAKIILIFYISRSLVKKDNKLYDFVSGYLPNLIVLSLFFLLILFQPDLGTALIISAAVFLLFIVSGVKPAFLALSVLSAIPFITAAVITVGYRLRRLVAFWDPWSDPTDAGFQIIQSFYGFGRGGITGVGLGNGKQKLFYLPEPHTDFIFSVIGEELGFVGASIVISLFIILIWRGFYTSITCNDLLGKYISFGLTAQIALQVLLNIGVSVGSLPTKGIPLPLISMGGSSLVVTLASIGIILNISEHKV